MFTQTHSYVCLTCASSNPMIKRQLCCNLLHSSVILLLNSYLLRSFLNSNLSNLYLMPRILFCVHMFEILIISFGYTSFVIGMLQSYHLLNFVCQENVNEAFLFYQDTRVFVIHGNNFVIFVWVKVNSKSITKTIRLSCIINIETRQGHDRPKGKPLKNL